MEIDWFHLMATTKDLVLPVAFFAFVLGGFVKGAMGLGMPVTVVSILCLVTDVRTSAMLALMPVLVTNLWQCWNSGFWLKTYIQYWRLTISMSAFLLATSFISVEFPQHLITVSVGLVVVLFAVANLWMRSAIITSRMDPSAQYAAGLATGILGGLSGLIVVPLAIYFTAKELDKEVFIRSTAPFFFLGAVLLFIGYSYGEVLKTDLVLQSSVLVVPAMIGLVAGEKVRQFIPDEKFRPMVLTIFLFIGLNLIQRGFVG